MKKINVNGTKNHILIFWKFGIYLGNGEDKGTRDLFISNYDLSVPQIIGHSFNQGH